MSALEPGWLQRQADLAAIESECRKECERKIRLRQILESVRIGRLNARDATKKIDALYGVIEC